MPRLTNPDRLQAYLDALGNWHLDGYVRFSLNEQAYRWLKREIGITVKDLARRMHVYVAGGGEIDEVVETRDEWSDKYEFHHDLRFTIDGIAVYVETRLHYQPPFRKDEPSISVVNIHAP